MPTIALIARSGPFEAHYFDTAGESEIAVPAGEVEVDVMHGFENHFEQRKVNVKAESTSAAYSADDTAF